MVEEIQLDNLESIDIGSSMPEVSLDGDLNSSEFGSGIELLMNEKVKNSSKKSESSNSLKNLENDISEIDNIGGHSLPPDINKEIHLDKKESFNNKPTIEIAKATSHMEMGNETWDGFKNLNSINIEEEERHSKRLSAQELLKEKFEILRKLENLETKGATLSKKYSMESDLEEMKGEYEHLIQEKEKSNSVKFQGKILTTLITGLEFLNNRFDPFDVKLDGWSEQINENIDDYDEIFAEIHEKYKSKAKMAPELKLLFQLASSGIMIHMTNTMFKSALPGMDDIMRQNPDLMNHFTKAAISSMETKTPGLGNFMNDFGMSHSRETNDIRSRPEQFSSQQSEPVRQTQQKPPPPMRQEMRGPNNIDSLLSTLGGNESKNVTLDKDSTISIEDVDNLSLSSSASNKRKSSKRKSNKSVMSLPI